MCRGIGSGKETKKVLICHYRVGWTDGVSLEIDKRANVLNELGWQVFLLAGTNSEGADYIVDELDFDLPEIRKITNNSFNKIIDYKNESELINHINDLADRIKVKLELILDKLKPDFILLHNIFSHGRHIACAKSFYEILEERKIPSLATHHDFYWEREHLKQPVGKLIDDFLKKYVPPVLPALNHAVINSISAKKLLNKTGITAAIIPDTFDFTMSPWVKDDYNKYLISDFNLNENDIFILQATRIVKRKGIELIPPIIQRLNSPEYLNQLNGQKLYNGKIVTEQSRFVLLLAGYAEDEATIYLNLLKNQMIKLKIPHCFMKDRIAAERKIHNSVKFYSLFDTYPYSDLISFPSQFEGWGNQFLEAVFAKKPVMIFEYPVFKKDIKPFGYHFISMGDKILSYDDDLIHLSDEKIELVCNEIIRTLKSNRTNEKLEYNYKLAEKNNSQTYLSRLMKWSMDHYED